MSNPKRQWHATKALLGGFLHMFVGGSPSEKESVQKLQHEGGRAGVTA